jgi:hypothetical protein
VTAAGVAHEDEGQVTRRSNQIKARIIPRRPIGYRPAVVGGRAWWAVLAVIGGQRAMVVQPREVLGRGERRL